MSKEGSSGLRKAGKRVTSQGRFLKTEGTVLASLGFGEGHKMVTIFTGSRGKIDASAFGVRKTKSRFGSSLELFTMGSFLLYRSRPENPYTVREVDVISSNTALRENLGKYLIGSAIVETLVRYVDREQPDPGLHALLTSALLTLDRVPEERGMALLCLYELGFLDVMGYRTDPDRCSVCGGRLEETQQRFADHRSGFPVCERCAGDASGGDPQPVPGQAVRFVRWAAANGPASAGRVAMKSETLRSVRRLIECLYAAVFGRLPESWGQLSLLQQ
ncbi:MAG: DNA repair protein RecO [Spirochaetota bacterium]